MSGKATVHRLIAALLAALFAGAALGQPSEAAAQSVPAMAHLKAARRLAEQDPALKQALQRGCGRTAVPRDAATARQRLQRAEAAWREERQLDAPREPQLRQAVVERGCAAYHATRLEPGSAHPLWLFTQIEIQSLQPSAEGLVVQARASTPEGPVANSRITLSRGLHHACFALTDADGVVRCALLDTHPHASGLAAWSIAHEGPIVATVAGNVTPRLVQLPAVHIREMPVFLAARLLR